MKRSAFLLLAMLTLAGTGLMHAAPGDIVAEIIAPSDSPSSWVSEGHAFLCLSVESASGVQEECYGFYNTSHSGQVFIGSPALTGLFQKSAAKDAKATWSLRKKITESQRQQVLDLVSRVNGGSSDLLAVRLDDFIAYLVNLFGWKRAAENPSPQTYVRELYLANLTGYDYKGGVFTRTKTGWEEVKTGKSDTAPKKGKGPPPGVHTYKELSHDDTWLLLKDPDRAMEVRLPLHAGMSQWKSKTEWVGLFEVTPKVE
jgi:hypothetical protein